MIGGAIIWAGLLIYFGLSNVANAIRGVSTKKPLTPGQLRMREVISRERKTWPWG